MKEGPGQLDFFDKLEVKEPEGPPMQLEPLENVEPQKFYALMQAIGKNPATPRSLDDLLFAYSYISFLRGYAARTSNADPERLSNIAKITAEDAYIQKSIAENPQSPLAALHTVIQNAMTSRPYRPHVIVAALENKNLDAIPPTILHPLLSFCKLLSDQGKRQHVESVVRTLLKIGTVDKDLQKQFEAAARGY